MVQKKQINALLRKSLAFQRKNYCMNACLIISPIVLTGLLGLLQFLIGRVITDENKCGCACVRCETLDGTITTDFAVCNSPSLDFEASVRCLSRDKNRCGAEFSDFENIVWCENARPSRYPPIYALDENIADVDAESGDYEVQQSVDLGADATARYLWTGGANEAFTSAVVQRLIRQPDLLRIASDPQIAADIEALGNSTSVASQDFTFLSRIPIDLGTGDTLISFFVDQGLLNARVVAENCEAFNTQVDSVLAATGGADAPAPNAAGDTNAGGGGGGVGLLERFQNSCVNGVTTFETSVSEIERKLFCQLADVKDKRCQDLRTANPEGWQLGASDAYDWKTTAAGKLDVDIWHNDESAIGGESDDGPISLLKRLPKPIDRATNSFLHEWLGEQYTARLLSVADMPKVENELNLDISSLLGPLIFLLLIQIPLPVALVLLVYEKEKRLRMMMRMHGLTNGVYILVTYLYLIIVHILYNAVMMAFGAAVNLGMFRNNDAGVQIIFYFLYANVQVAFAFLCSCFFSKKRTALVVGFLWILGSALLFSQLLSTLISSERWFTTLLEIVPTFGAYRGLWELGEYAFAARYRGTGGGGMGFSDLFSDGNGMGEVWIIFIIEWPIFMLLAWYLEQVISSGTGIRRHWLFPFQRTPRLHGTKKGDSGEHQTINMTALDSDLGDLSEDVVRERERAYATEPGPEHPIVVRDLRKVFPPHSGKQPHVAVANMSAVIEEGECFGLLGPNGAGKTTSINMMIGFLEATKGEAFIAGKDIRTHMNSIYEEMGVCPQHDLLWETLTAKEHLMFYARLKGLTGKELKAAVEETLKSVRLADVGNKRISKFSGGMKRRLSVAISLIGSPKVAYLDEPSTGLDPASRRNLWTVVKDAKAGKAVVLTTHSMEEAEVLCDRLGIFVAGRLVCLGNPKQLTARYGGYYVLTMTVPVGDRSAETKANEFVHSLCTDAKQTYCLGGTIKFELPCSAIQLSDIFDRVAAAQEAGLPLTDWGVHNASLEDVFIRLAAAAEDKADGGTVAQL